MLAQDGQKTSNAGPFPRINIKTKTAKEVKQSPKGSLLMEAREAFGYMEATPTPFYANQNRPTLPVPAVLDDVETQAMELGEDRFVASQQDSDTEDSQESDMEVEDEMEEVQEYERQEDNEPQHQQGEEGYHKAERDEPQEYHEAENQPERAQNLSQGTDADPGQIFTEIRRFVLMANRDVQQIASLNLDSNVDLPQYQPRGLISLPNVEIEGDDALVWLTEKVEKPRERHGLDEDGVYTRFHVAGEKISNHLKSIFKRIRQHKTTMEGFIKDLNDHIERTKQESQTLANQLKERFPKNDKE